MPSDRHDANRLASELLTLAAESGNPEEIEHDLADILELVNNTPSLRQFLADPFVTDAGKEKALLELVDKKPAYQELVRFMHRKGIIRHALLLEKTARIFFSQRAREKNKTAGELIAPVPLSKTKIQEIEKAASAILGKQLTLRMVSDPSMLGGMIIRVGDVIVDVSTDRWLENIRTSLLKG